MTSSRGTKEVFELFKPKVRSVLGVDITSTSIHILEFTISGDQCRVDGYGSAYLPENVFEGSLIKDSDAIAACIRSVLSQNRIKTKKTILAVPDSTAISKTIQVNEGLKDDEIEELVFMEADKYIPYPIDEINLDFNVLGVSAKNSTMVDVLIVASRTEHVNNRVEAISKAGLEPYIVDVESYAIERTLPIFAPSLPAGGVHKNIAIIDIGALFTKFYVFHNLKLIFSREEEFGAKQLLETIKVRYNLEKEQALEVIEGKKEFPDYETEVLQPFKEQIMLHAKRAIQFFYSNTNHNSIDHILLAGGIANQPELVSLLQEYINIPTTLANPFQLMEISPQIDKDQINQSAPRLLVACGLALRACG